MKKPDNKKLTAAKIVAGVAATLVVGANVTGCVYGPPPEETTSFNPSWEEPTEAYGSFEDFDPSDNDTVAEYEAPEDPDMTDNMNADVYGPPSDFDMDDNLTPAVYGPPSDQE